jgi:putative DNA primase/helicase
MTQTQDIPYTPTPFPEGSVQPSEISSSTPRLTEVQRFNRTDSGNAELFAALFGRKVRYDHTARRWFIWRGNWWTTDDASEVAVLVKFLARWRKAAASTIEDPDKRTDEFKWARRSEFRGAIDATIKLAQSEPPIADDGKGWDLDPMLFGVANGVVDLKTGQLRPGKQSDRITQHSNVVFDQEAQCRRFERFLTEIFAGNRELIEYVQKSVGYCLTGITTEQILFLCHGRGANGKSTFLDILRFVFGDYGYNLPFSAFEVKNKSQIPNEIAALTGKRFVSAIETDESTQLNESRIKALTGSDPITARFLYREFFTFNPTGKFWLAFNNCPSVTDDSPGFWRRIRLIPFVQEFSEDKRDPNLMEKLKAEAPGILNWAIQGALKWQAEGVNPPQIVIEQSQRYREESDPLAEFLEECCELAQTAQVTAKEIWSAYLWWAKSNNERSVDRKVFSRRMRSHGFKCSRLGHDRTYTWLGIRLKRVNWPPTNPSNMRADADVKMPLLNYEKQIEERI